MNVLAKIILILAGGVDLPGKKRIKEIVQFVLSGGGQAYLSLNYFSLSRWAGGIWSVRRGLMQDVFL
jgi:hypothetical protein